MAGEQARPLDSVSLGNLRFGIVQGGPLNGLDANVTERFADALNVLGQSGCRLKDERIALLDELPRVQGKGPLLFTEAFAIHEERLKTRPDAFDPAVRAQIERGRGMSAADLIRLQRARARLISAMDLIVQEFDALIMPTTKIVAPLISEIITPEGNAAKQPLIAGNTSIVNFLDLCAISLPISRASGLPVGLMLIGRNGRDRRLLRIAAAVEQLLG